MLPADPRQAPYFGLTLVVAWMLEFEMYFYLIFAASMLFKRLRWVALVAWVVLTVLVLPYAERGFNLSVEGGPVYPVGYLSIVTSPFVLEFLIGVAIGWLYSQPWLRVRSRQLAWNMLALGVTYALWHTRPSVLLTTVCSVAMAALSHRNLEQELSNLVRDGLLKLLPARPAPAARRA
ncbi:hypothetical protein RugamoR57_28770 [Duganella caerulea]|uniref:hypothetical protein n=1 Tax=Duganella caerulea TaxID=2885762 RepID=UPI0030EA472D